MSDTAITIPLNCLHCGGSIEVACGVDSEGGPQTVRFKCPYCGASREFVAPGVVMFVAARQPGAGPETKH